jgi:hypothetical protein
MYDAMAYYVLIEELCDGTLRRRRIAQLSELIVRTDLPNAIAQRIRMHRDAVEVLLVSTLKTLLV